MLGLQKLSSIIPFLEHDVVQRLDADVELKVDVQPFENKEQRVLDLGEVAQRGRRSRVTICLPSIWLLPPLHRPETRHSDLPFVATVPWQDPDRFAITLTLDLDQIAQSRRILQGLLDQ